MTALLFCSGGAALVYQVAWMRELRLVFGGTTAAVAAVLAIFMGGLGLGSAVLGKRAERAANPLLMYGALEIAVSICVAASPWLVTLVRVIYIALGGQESLGMFGATVVRLALAAVVLGVPTFLMGGTLPAAVRYVTRASDTRRLSLAVLYGGNTLGAVCGAALATFFALEQLGTHATLWAACAVNLLVGMAAYLRSGGVGANVAKPQAEIARDRVGDETDVARGVRVAYFAAAVLGFTFFAMELVWFRMLAPILGGTTFTFGLILCMALLGIGIGGALYNVVFRWVRPSWSLLALTCAAEACAAAVPFAMGDRVALLAGRLSQEAGTFGEMVWGWSVVMSIVVLPAALVSGLQFPLLVGLLGEGRSGVGRQLGTAYAWNTLGAIAGSLAGGFGALPLLTAPGTWRAVVVMLVALAGLLAVSAGRTGIRSLIGAAVLGVVAIACVFQQGPTAAWRHGGIGARRATIPFDDANRTRFWLNEKRRELVVEADGVESTIGITATDSLSFFVNGKSDGNAIGDAATQVGAALVGAALHPDPRRALVIGLGTGETAGWLADMREIEQLDVVELEPAVDEMARLCAPMNRNVLENPKVRRIYDDGREFVLTNRNKYDLVVSEPSNPYRAGVATLFTSEFYRSVAERLNDDGLFLQWVQAYEIDGNTVEIVLSTVRSVFPHVEVWQSMPGDLLLVCSIRPRAYSVDALRARVGTGVLREALEKAWQVHDLEGFLARFVASAQFVDSVGRTSQLRKNTDDQTVLEYGFAKAVGREEYFSLPHLRDLATNNGWHRPPVVGGEVDWETVEIRRLEMNVISDGTLATSSRFGSHHTALVGAFQEYRDGKFAESVENWPREAGRPLDDIQRMVLGLSYAELGRDECLELVTPVAERRPAEVAAVKAIFFWRQKRTAEALDALDILFTTLKENPWAVSRPIITAIDLAPQLALADHDSAPRLFQLLKEPFSVYRCEQQRRIVALTVAELVGPEAIVEALAAMEPNVPWVGPVLKERARIYAKLAHPLAARAQREWDEFERSKK